MYQETLKVLETDTRVLNRETLLIGLKMVNRGIGNDTFFYVGMIEEDWLVTGDGENLFGINHIGGVNEMVPINIFHLRILDHGEKSI